VATLTDLLTSKIPPHSLEAERAVLGRFCSSGRACPRPSSSSSRRLLQGRQPQDLRRHLALFERNEPVDLLTVSEELKRRATLEEVGGAAALASLVEEAATAAHLLSYGAIVREKALLRDLIRIATEISAELRGPRRRGTSCSTTRSG